MPSADIGSLVLMQNHLSDTNFLPAIQRVFASNYQRWRARRSGD
jgi:hypothetical protein